MEYYSPHELVRIGLGIRKTNVYIQCGPRKQHILEEEGEVLHPFFWLEGPNGPTEREQTTPHLM